MVPSDPSDTFPFPENMFAGLGIYGCMLVYLFNEIKENERGIMPLLKRRKERKKAKQHKISTLSPLSPVFFFSM